MSNKNFVEKQKKDVIALAVLVIALIIFLAITLVRAATTKKETSSNSNMEDEKIAIANEVNSNRGVSTILGVETTGDNSIANIATGSNFTIILDSEGKVWSWGLNNKGQLGNGTLKDGDRKEAVIYNGSQLSNIKQIVAGEYHAVALDKTGKVYMWGYNYFGQIGLMDKRVETTAQLLELPSGTSIKQIAAGADYTIMLTTDGKIMGLGDSTNGQLGYYNSIGFTSIRNVNEVDISNIKKISAGYNHVIALDNNGAVWSWGDTTGSGFANVSVKEISGFDTTVIDIDAGNGVSIAVDSSGNVYTWDYTAVSPTKVTLGGFVQIETSNYLDSIAVVNKTYYLISDNKENGDKEVYSWGANTIGQTGTGTNNTVSTPTKLVFANDTINQKIDKVSSSAVPGSIGSTVSTTSTTSYDAAYAINEEGFVVGWGYAGTDITDANYTEGNNTYKLLGDGTRNKADYIGSVSVKSVVVDDIVLDISSNGVANGKNTMNLAKMLADEGFVVGGRVNVYKTVTEDVMASLNIKSVNNDIANYDSNTGYITGNKQGITAVEVESTKNCVYINVRVVDGDNSVYPKVESERYFTVALKADGTVWTWGYDEYLGIVDNYHNNNYHGIIVPTQVKGLENIVDIATGEHFVAVLKADGTIWTWGYNNYGQLGNNTTSTDKSTTSIMDVAPTLTQVSLGESEIVTVPKTREVPVLDGKGNQVYEDDGITPKMTTENYTEDETRINLTALSNVKQIAAGKDFAMALAEVEGVQVLYTWGYNNYGQLGNKARDNYIPYAVKADLTNLEGETIKQIEAGNSETAYILTNVGNVYSWGYNGNNLCGQSGSYIVPTKVNTLNRILKISAGEYQTFALNVNGKVFGFGSWYGMPTLLDMNKVTDISARPYDEGVLVKTSDSKVTYINRKDTAVLKTADDTEEFTNAMLIEAGVGFYTVAKPDGTVWTTGVNSYGQLGNRTDSTSDTKYKLKEITKAYYSLNINEVTLNENGTKDLSAIFNPGFNLIYIDVENVNMTYTSLDSTIATIENGNTIRAVKQGTTYIIAEDSQSGTKLRVRVNVLNNKESAFPVVSVGYRHTVALKADGTVWGYGYNAYGELGFASAITIAEPEMLFKEANYKYVAAGTYHTLMLTKTGKVMAMGYNNYGQLGNGTTNNSAVPVIVMINETDELTNIVKIAAYDYMSLALDKDGNLYAWGAESSKYATKVNTYGLKVRDISERLLLTEDGRVLEYVKPSEMRYKEGLENIVEISSAGYNTIENGYYLALNAEGNVYTWIRRGSSDEQALGTESGVPTQIDFSSVLTNGETIVDVEAGIKSAYAKDSNGKVYSFGKTPLTGTLGLGDSVSTATVPTIITVAELQDTEVLSAAKYNNGRTFISNTKGSVYGFGKNGSNNLLGKTDTTEYYYEPTQVGESFAGFLDKNGNEVVRVSLEKGTYMDLTATLIDSFNLRVASSENATETNFTWSVFNKDLITLSGTTGKENRITANTILGEAIIVAKDSISGKSAKLYVDVVETGTKVAPKVEASNNHTIALKADGTVWAWGDNSNYQLGIDNGGETVTAPTQVRIANRIEVKTLPTKKLDGEGKVVLTNGKETYEDTKGSTYLYSDNDYTDEKGNILIKKDSRDNKYYRYDGIENDYIYEDILDEQGNPIVIVDIATCATHTLLLSNTGKVYSCGYNSNWYANTLGYSTGSQYYGYTAKEIPGLKDIVKVTASSIGGQYSIALDKYGRAWFFGYIYNYGYNNNSQYVYIYQTSSTPSKIISFRSVNLENTFKDAVDITNEYILTSDGEVISIGTNINSIATGETVQGLIGEKVIKITSTNNTSHTERYSAFLTDNGTIYTIGAGSKGQLGNDSSSDSIARAVPVLSDDGVTKLSNIRDIYTGNTHAIAIDKNGAMYSWGENAYKKLRTSTTEQSGGSVPRAFTVASDERITKAIAVAAGANHTAVVNKDGFVYAWGAGENGQLGNSISANSERAVRVGTEGIVLKNSHITLQENGSGYRVNATSNILNLLHEQNVKIDRVESLNNGIVSTTILDDNTFEVRPVLAGRTTIKVIDKDGGIKFAQAVVLPRSAEININLPIEKIAEPMTASGESHTLILKSDGTVYAYGENTYGQTSATDSDGRLVTYSDMATKVEFPQSASPIIQVGAGNGFSVALDSVGNVYVWGYNGDGVIGNGTIDGNTHIIPTKVASLRRIVKIAVGDRQIIAIDADGFAYSWGKNSNGSLGIGTTSNVTVPKKVSNVANVIDAAIGSEHALLLTGEGKVYSTGYNNLGQLGEIGLKNRLKFEEVTIGEKIVSIAAGGATNIVIDELGHAWGWGRNQEGQLGIVSENSIVAIPTRIIGISERIVKASVGNSGTNNHAHLITTSGTLYVAGSNNLGQLGLGDKDITNKKVFTQITSFGNNVMNSDAGATYSTVIDKDGKVYGFGDYNHGYLERISLTNSFSPVMITDTTSYLNEQEVTLNIDGTYEIKANGKNRLNVLHKDNSQFTYQSVNDSIATVDANGVVTGVSVGTTLIKVIDTEDNKVNVLTIKVIPQDGILAPVVDSGDKFTVLTDMDGIVYAFGYKENVAIKNMPKEVNTSIALRSVKAGNNFVIAVNNDGTIWGWGDNSKSQLGFSSEEFASINNTKRLNSSYVKDIVQIGAGNNHAIALDNLGTVYVWGDNTKGQLGIEPTGENTIIETPKAIRPVSAKIISVSAGGDYSAIVDATGKAYIIKDGRAYEISGISGAVKVATGDQFTLVLTNTGKVYKVANSSVSATLESTSGKTIVDIATDNGVVMLLASDKTLWLYGDNTYGKLGLGINDSYKYSLTKAAENVFTMGAGQNNTYYIATNGEAFSTGLNTSGELGNRTVGSQVLGNTYNNKYVGIGDRTIFVDPSRVAISVNWNLYVGGKELEAHKDDPKSVVSLLTKQNEFNVFKNQVTNLDEFNFEIEDTSIAEIVDQNVLKIQGKADGTTVLNITNKVTGAKNELTIFVINENLLRIKNVFADDTQKQFKAEISESAEYIINTEGSLDVGTLNIQLNNNDTIKVYEKADYQKPKDERGNGYTLDKVDDIYVINGFDLSKEIQEIIVELTDFNGTVYALPVTLYKEDMVKVNNEMLKPVQELVEGEDEDKLEKIYTKYINPQDLSATVEIFAADIISAKYKDSKVTLLDSNGTEIIVGTTGEKITSSVDTLNRVNTFMVNVSATNRDVEREEIIRTYTIRIIKGVMKSIELQENYSSPEIVIADVDSTNDGTIYLDKYIATIDDRNVPANITIKLNNADNITSVKVNNEEKLSTMVDSALNINKVIRDGEEFIIDVKVKDAVTLAEHTEKYLLIVNTVKSNNDIDYIELLQLDTDLVTEINGIKDKAPYRSRLEDKDNKTVHEIILHTDASYEFGYANFEVNLVDSEDAKFSYGTENVWKKSGKTFANNNMENAKMLTENQYQPMTIWVKAENGEAKSHTLKLYKQSENARIDEIVIRSDNKDKVAIKEVGTDNYKGQVYKDQSSYIVTIKLVDEYSTIASIAVDGINDVTTILTPVSGANGVYVYTTTPDILGKEITIVTKAEYENAPQITSTLVIKEMDDNANIEYIGIDTKDVLNQQNKDQTEFNVAISESDNGVLYVKAESKTADVAVYTADPRTNANAEPIAKGIESVTANVPFENGVKTATIYVKVTSEDGEHSIVKVINIRRNSNDASIISIKAVKDEYKSQSAVFDEDRNVYVLTIPENVTTPNIVIKTSDADAIVTISEFGPTTVNAEGDKVTSVDLTDRDSLRVIVTPEDGSEPKEYIVEINKVSSDVSFTKQIRKDDRIIKLDQEFSYDENTRTYEVEVLDTLGLISLNIEPKNENTKASLAIIKQGSTDIIPGENDYYEKEIYFGSDVTTEIKVTLRAPDETTVETYTVRVISKHNILSTLNVSGLNASNTVLETKTIESTKVKNDEVTITINPESTKVGVKVNIRDYLYTLGSEAYKDKVTVSAIAYPYDVDRDNNSISQNVNVTINNNSTATLDNVNFLNDEDSVQIMIMMEKENGDRVSVLLTVKKGSYEAELDKITVGGTGVGSTEYKIAEYLNPAKKYVNELLLWTEYEDDEGRIQEETSYDLDITTVNDIPYTLYKLPNSYYDTPITSIDLTSADAENMGNNRIVTLTDGKAVIIVNVQAEYGSKTQPYKLQLRVKEDNAKLKDLTYISNESALTAKQLSTLYPDGFEATYNETTGVYELNAYVLSDTNIVTISNVVLDGSKASAKWTDISAKEISDITDADYSDYVSGDEKQTIFDPMNNTNVKRMYIKVTAENGSTKTYAINIIKVSSAIELKDIKLFNIVTEEITLDNGAKEDREVEYQVAETIKDRAAEILDSIGKIKLEANQTGISSIKVSKVNGHTINEIVKTDDYKVNKNELVLELTRTYTYTDENEDIQTILPSEVKTITFEVELKSSEYLVFPEDYTGGTEIYEFTVTRLSTDTNITIKIEDYPIINTATGGFKAPVEENGIPVYRKEILVSSKQASIVYTGIIANNANTTIKHGSDIGSSLYSNDNPAIMSFDSNNSIVDRIEVTNEADQIVIYELTFIKKSGDATIDGIKLNGGLTSKSEDAINSYNGMVLRPLDDLIVEALNVNEKATAEMHIISINGNATDINSLANSTDYYDLENPRDLMAELRALLNELSMPINSINEIIITIKIQPEDEEVEPTTYSLKVKVDDSLLASINGLDVDGNVADDKQLLHADFKPLTEGVFETDVIVVPNDTDTIELTEITSELDNDLVMITDENGNELTSRSLTITNLSDNNVTTAIIKIFSESGNQEFHVRVRKASTNTDIQNVKSEDKLDYETNGYKYTVDVKDIKNPEVEVILADKNAKVVSAKVVGTVDNLTVQNNKFIVPNLAANGHNLSEDTDDSTKYVYVTIGVQAESSTTPVKEYTIKLVRKHTETGITSVKYLANDEVTIDYTTKDSVTKTIPSTIDKVKLTEIITVCANANVKVDGDVFDATKEYAIAEGQTKTFTITIEAEYGNTKDYTLEIKRLSGNNNIENLKLDLGNGKTIESVTYDSVDEMYKANINVTENPRVMITPKDLENAELVGDVKVYITTEGDLADKNVTITNKLSKEFTISGLSGLYVDDETQHTDDSDRVIIVKFTIAAEDTTQTKEYTLQLTRKHAETGINDITYSFDYIKEDTTTDTISATAAQDPTSSNKQIYIDATSEEVIIDQITPICDKASIKLLLDGVEIQNSVDGITIPMPETVAGDGAIKKLKIIVTAEDSTVSQEYIVDIIREAKNASLILVYVNDKQAIRDAEDPEEAGIEAIYRADVFDTDTIANIIAISANTTATVSISHDDYPRYTTKDNSITYKEEGTYNLNNLTDKQVILNIVVTPNTGLSKTYKLIITRKYNDYTLERISIAPVYEVGQTGPNEPVTILTDDFKNKAGWYQTNRIVLNKEWNVIKLKDLVPGKDKMTATITQISQANPFYANTIKQYELDYSMSDSGIGEDFIMPEGQEIYFKIVTTAESGATNENNPYILVLYKKATDVEVQSVVVNGRTATWDETTQKYVVDISVDDSNISVNVNTTNNIDVKSSVVSTVTNSRALPTEIRTRTGKGNNDKSLLYTMSDVTNYLDDLNDKILTVTTSLHPEDSESPAKAYNIEIRRCSTNTQIEFINLNQNIGNSNQYAVTLDGDFTTKLYKQSSALNVVHLDNIKLVSDFATYRVKVRGSQIVYTKDDLDNNIEFSLTNEKDEITFEIEVIPEFSGARSVTKLLTVRRMSSDAALSEVYLTTEAIYPNTATYPNYSNRNVIDLGTLVANIHVEDVATTIYANVPRENKSTIDMVLAEIKDSDGTDIDITNKLSNKISSDTLQRVKLDTSVGRLFKVKISVQPEDPEIEPTEYELTIVRQDTSTEIESILGNNEVINPEPAELIAHYRYFGKTQADDTIYAMYLDEDSDVNEVLVDINTKSPFAKIYIADSDTDPYQEMGTGTVQDYSVATNNVFNYINVKVVSEDGRTTTIYKVLFIRKSGNTNISAVYVDDEAIPVNQADGNYYVTISDITKRIKVRMLPEYAYANVSINGQQAKWQDVTEVIENINTLTLVNGKVQIALQVIIPAQMSSTGELLQETKYLYVERVSTENTIESITTDNYNDSISNEPQYKWHDNRYSVSPDTYNISLESAGIVRNTIDLEIQPTSPTAKVEIYDMDGNLIDDSIGLLSVSNLPINKDGMITYRVKVTPKITNYPKEYYIDIVSPASNAELRNITIVDGAGRTRVLSTEDGYDVKLINGQYFYAIHNLGIEGIGSVSALAEYHDTSSGNKASKVKIYTLENPTGSEEQVGSASLNNIDFDNTKYVSVTVVSPDGNNTNTYVLWLEQVSDDRGIGEIRVNGEIVEPLRPMSKDLSLEYADEYVANIEPTVEEAVINIASSSQLAIVRYDFNGDGVFDSSEEQKASIQITKDVKDINQDLVLTAEIEAESGNKALYRIVIHKYSYLTGYVTNENNVKNYAEIPVKLIDNNGNEFTETTDRNGNVKVKVENGKTYTITITKPGYLPYTITDFSAEYGTINFIGDINLLAGDINSDGKIDLRDLTQTNKLAQTGTPVTDADTQKYDFDGSGTIDDIDVRILAKNYGKTTITRRYSKTITIYGDILDKIGQKVPNATIIIGSEAINADENGTFKLGCVLYGNNTLTVKDADGVVIGIADISIVEGSEFAINTTIADGKSTIQITVNKNRIEVPADATVNGIIAAMNKHGEESSIKSPEITDFTIDFTDTGIDLETIVSDGDLNSVAFYIVDDADIDQALDTTANAVTEIGTLIYSESVSGGTNVSVTKSYIPATLPSFLEKVNVKVVAIDAAGNSVRQVNTVECNVIRTAEELVDFANKVSSTVKDENGQPIRDIYSVMNVKLGADIDMTSKTLTPIGKNSGMPFKGVFDGNNHIIKGLSIDVTSNNIGLFGYTNGATIKNLGIESSTIKAKNYVGGLVGYAKDTIIENCYSSATVIATSGNAGGLVGYIKGNVTIENCYSAGNITGTTAGGLVGNVDTVDATIRNCYSKATVSTDGKFIGAFKVIRDDITDDLKYSTIEKCYIVTDDSTATGIQTTILPENCNLDITIPSQTDANTLLFNLSYIDENGQSKNAFKIVSGMNDGYPVLSWQKVSTTSSINSVTEESNYELPLSGEYTITSDYGTRVDPVTGEESVMHYGMDISTGANDIVYAIADGTVTYVAAETEPGVGYGNCIEIRHEIDGKVFYSFYAHLKELPTLEVGDSVKKGDEIGIEGESGKATGIHLHFEIRLISQDYSSAVDPKTYLDF